VREKRSLVPRGKTLAADSEKKIQQLVYEEKSGVPPSVPALRGWKGKGLRKAKGEEGTFPKKKKGLSSAIEERGVERKGKLLSQGWEASPARKKNKDGFPKKRKSRRALADFRRK